MSDTIRWCFTCKDRPFDNPGFNGCAEGHDVADALVVRAPVDYEAAEEAFSQRSTDSRAIVDAALGGNDE